MEYCGDCYKMRRTGTSRAVVEVRRKSSYSWNQREGCLSLLTCKKDSFIWGINSDVSRVTFRTDPLHWLFPPAIVIVSQYKMLSVSWDQSVSLLLGTTPQWLKPNSLQWALVVPESCKTLHLSHELSKIHAASQWSVGKDLENSIEWRYLLKMQQIFINRQKIVDLFSAFFTSWGKYQIKERRGKSPYVV